MRVSTCHSQEWRVHTRSIHTHKHIYIYTYINSPLTPVCLSLCMVPSVHCLFWGPSTATRTGSSSSSSSRVSPGGGARPPTAPSSLFSSSFCARRYSKSIGTATEYAKAAGEAVGSWLGPGVGQGFSTAVLGPRCGLGVLYRGAGARCGSRGQPHPLWG